MGFLEVMDEAIQSIKRTEFLNTTKGVGIFLILSFFFVCSMIGLLILVMSGSFRDFALQFNDYQKNVKQRYEKDYKYLEGLTYRDESTGKLYMIARVVQRGKSIEAYRQLIVDQADGPPIVQPGEVDGPVDVADVEHFLGLYNASTSDKKRD